jgi:RNA polymerase sigma-70 factor (ECF subfamily)
VHEAIRKLTRRQQLAIDCRYFVGLSISDIAAIMGCSEGTVKSTLSDARKRLRRMLEATPP